MLSYLLLLTSLFLAAVSGEFISTDYDDYNKGALGHRPLHEFYSSPETAPVLQVNTWNQTAVSRGGSHIFLRHDGVTASLSASPLVLSAHDLSTVFVNHTFANVFGTRVQEDRGQRYLTFWEGDKGDGVGNGFGLAYDENYHLRYKVSAQGLSAHSDLHEFALTGNGTALVIGIDKRRVSTAGWTGWRGAKMFSILDAVVQEIDLDTNEVLFSWRATDHIDPMESYENIAHNWDTYHINSIQKTEAGNYLISIRHTHAIYLVSGATGKILWTLGGKRNTFLEPMPPPSPSAPILSLAWQHHARFVPNTNQTQLTLFDNHVKATTHGVCTPASCSRGLHLALDTTASPPTVALLAEYQHPMHLQAQSQGSMQVLDAGADGAFARVLVGWGRCPSFTEHDAVTGETLLDVQFSPWHSDKIVDALDNYRAYRMDWVAEPWWDPVMALRAGGEDGGALDVYVSWNGATEVRGWAVRGLMNGSSVLGRDEAPVLARSVRTGFETKMNLTRSAGLLYVWAEALDAQGKVIRETDVVDFSAGGNVTIIPFSDHDFEEVLEATLAAGHRWPVWVWAVLGGAVVGLSLASVGARIVLRRYQAYDALDAEGFDLDAESDVDEDEVPLGVDFLRADEQSEPWQDYMMYAPQTTKGPRDSFDSR